MGSAQRYSVKLRVVTPAFIGGADPWRAAEFRPNGIKSLLRLWYRALHPDYGERVRTAGGKAVTNEMRLFGWSGDVGQGLFGMRRGPDPAAENRAPGIDRGKQGLAYLGFGPLDPTGVVRPAYAPGTALPLEFIFRPGAEPRDVEAVFLSLWALCTFGGVGSRWRRGWGSLKLGSIETSTDKSSTDLSALVFNPQDGQGLKDHIESTVGPNSLRNDPLPPHPAASRRALGKIVEQRGDAMAALARAGEILRNGERNLPLEARVGFGLPRRGANVAGVKRRASPLLIHIHPLASGNHAIVFTFLPATFLQSNPSDHLHKVEEFVKGIDGLEFRFGSGPEGAA